MTHKSSSDDEFNRLQGTDKNFYDLQDLIDGILEDKLPCILTDDAKEPNSSRVEIGRRSEQIKRIYTTDSNDQGCEIGVPENGIPDTTFSYRIPDISIPYHGYRYTVSRISVYRIPEVLRFFFGKIIKLKSS